MNKIQEILIKSYTILIMAERMTIEEVPETKLIGGAEYPIRTEVEIEIAKRTLQVLA